MSTVNSFKTRRDLNLGGRTVQYLQPAGASRRRLSRNRPPAVLAEDPAREPAAPRGRPLRQGGRHRGAGAVGRQEHGAAGDLVRAGARAAAGLHRRALRSSISRRCATASRGSAAIRTASTRCSRSSSSSITRCRSTTSARPNAFQLNAELEFSRNKERYAFLRWGQNAFGNFRVVPPDTGIVHQVNLEYLARVVDVRRDAPDGTVAYPDTLVGTDSHTTMVNGLGVVGWGVGGIEAEAAMLGQPISMLIPPVLGVPPDRRDARRRDGDRPRADDHRAAAQARRRRQVRRVLRPGPRAPDDCRPRDARQHVPGVRRDDRDLPDRRDDARLPAADRPRRVARRSWSRRTRRRRGCSARRAIPIRSTRRRSSSIWRRVEPSLAGPAAAAGSRVAEAGEERLPDGAAHAAWPRRPRKAPQAGGSAARVGDAPAAAAAVAEIRRPSASSITASVVIAAITSCTNTSNPSVMIGAGLLAKKAVERGLTRKPWVKTSLAPGSKVVTEYLRQAGPRHLSRCSSASTSSATAARPASATAGRCPTTCRAEVDAREPRRRVGAERQPQLRGTHPAAGARELSGVAAARRRLRARRAR